MAVIGDGVSTFCNVRAAGRGRRALAPHSCPTLPAPRGRIQPGRARSRGWCWGPRQDHLPGVCLSPRRRVASCPRMVAGAPSPSNAVGLLSVARSLEVCVAHGSARSPPGLPRCFGDLPWPRAFLLLSMRAFATGFQSPTFPFAKCPLAPVWRGYRAKPPRPPPPRLWAWHQTPAGAIPGAQMSSSGTLGLCCSSPSPVLGQQVPPGSRSPPQRLVPAASLS